jgi:hypothetical protein
MKNIFFHIPDPHDLILAKYQNRTKRKNEGKDIFYHNKSRLSRFSFNATHDLVALNEFRNFR